MNRRSIIMGAALLLLALPPSGRAAGETAPPPPAAGDSAAVMSILARRSADLDSLLLPESTRIDSTGIDSLVQRFDAGGAKAISAFRPGWNRREGVAVSVLPLALTTYNRVEGFRLGAGLAIQNRDWFRLEGAAAYGFSNHRWGGQGIATAGGPRRPRLELKAENLVEPFGPGALEYTSAAMALLAGQDRQDYLRRKEARVTFWPARIQNGSVKVSVFQREDSPVEETTDFDLIGGDTPIKDPNPPVNTGRTRAVSLGGKMAFGGDLLAAEIEAGVAGGGLGGDFSYSWQAGRATIRPVLPDGGIFSIALEGASVGGAAPFQVCPFLGGEGNLRGYHRLEFVGNREFSARIEYEMGLDLLGRTGIPFLKPLRIQFIPFADLGTTWGLPEPALDSGTGGSAGATADLPWGQNLEGSIRSSVGIGFQRELWLPGVRAIRLDLTRRTDGNDKPWSLWFRILPLSF